jgi:hypothetical protein
MTFITSDKEFITNNISIIYFYSEDNDFIVNKTMLSMLDIIERDFNNKILCINVNWFDNLVKRCNIINVPTLLFYSDGREISRITNIPTLENIKNSLNFDI